MVPERIEDYARIGVVHGMAYPVVAEGERPFIETFREIVEDDYFTAVGLAQVRSERKAAEGFFRQSTPSSKAPLTPY